MEADKPESSATFVRIGVLGTVVSTFIGTNPFWEAVTRVLPESPFTSGAYLLFTLVLICASWIPFLTHRGPRMVTAAATLLATAAGLFIGWTAAWLIVGPVFWKKVEEDGALQRSHIETAQARAEANRLRGMKEIVDQYGGDLRSYRRWSVASDAGDIVPFGRCGKRACVAIYLEGTKGTGRDAIVLFQLLGPFGPQSFRLPLRSGCKRDVIDVGHGQGRITVEVEDDSYYDPKVAVVFSGRPIRPTPPPNATAVLAPDLTEKMEFTGLPGRVVCGDSVWVCRNPKPGEKEDRDMACLGILSPGSESYSSELSPRESDKD